MEVDRNAGAGRTDRTRYLAAQAALSLTEPLYDQFMAIELTSPLQETMARKRDAMRAAIEGYSKLVSYKVADVTAASTYYMAEIYYHFSQALKYSERPTNLSALEMEQYELALEEQIYPFEEKAIEVHEKNIELLHAGLYSPWIDKTIDRLAQLFPASYARQEEGLPFLDNLVSYRYDVRGPEAGLAAAPDEAPSDAASAPDPEGATGHESAAEPVAEVGQ